jgi:hypothetical protein
MEGRGCYHIIGVGAHGGCGAGGTQLEVEGRIVLSRPAVLPIIVFVLIAFGLCDGPG